MSVFTLIDRRGGVGEKRKYRNGIIKIGIRVIGSGGICLSARPPQLFICFFCFVSLTRACGNEVSETSE